MTTSQKAASNPALGTALASGSLSSLCPGHGRSNPVTMAFDVLSKEEKVFPGRQWGCHKGEVTSPGREDREALSGQ